MLTLAIGFVNSVGPSTLKLESQYSVHSSTDQTASEIAYRLAGFGFSAWSSLAIIAVNYTTAQSSNHVGEARSVEDGHFSSLDARCRAGPGDMSSA